MIKRKAVKMEFNQSFFDEETRCGFLVTKKRKKIWYIEMQLLQKFDEVCKKHHLTYFVDYGTLLGAVRHQGFVPWDDDIDVVMMRDEYTKLLEIAPQEFSEPYFFQTTYNDLQSWVFAKLRDSRTTAIEFPDMAPEFNQGIFIDIFPLDDAPDGKNFSRNITNIQNDIWLTITFPDALSNAMKQGCQSVIGEDLIYELINLPKALRFEQFEAFNQSHFGTSENVNLITEEILHLSPSRKRAWYSDVVYLPFEYLSVPAPSGYDQILTCQYGNYHELVLHGSAHEKIFIDPDTPYLYYINHPEKLP